MALIRATGHVIGAGAITSALIAANTIGADKINRSTGGRIVSITYPGGTVANSTVYSSSANVSTSGGQTVTITGSDFANGTHVFVYKTQASVVTVANTSTITFQTPAQSAGRYPIFVVATDGAVATFAPGIIYA